MPIGSKGVDVAEPGGDLCRRNMLRAVKVLPLAASLKQARKVMVEVDVEDVAGKSGDQLAWVVTFLSRLGVIMLAGTLAWYGMKTGPRICQVRAPMTLNEGTQDEWSVTSSEAEGSTDSEEGSQGGSGRQGLRVDPRTFAREPWRWRT